VRLVGYLKSKNCSSKLCVAVGTRDFSQEVMQMLYAVGRLLSCHCWLMLSAVFLVTVGSCCLQYLFPRVFLTALFASFVSPTKDDHFKRKTRGSSIYHVMRYLSY
jgi:hypothetical protein